MSSTTPALCRPSTTVRVLPLALYPTAAQDRLTPEQIAFLFEQDIREVRAMLAHTHDLLISRAREGRYVAIDWIPRSREYASVLSELSRSIFGHWSKLLTTTEREERRHVQFVLRVMRRQYQLDLKLKEKA